MEGPHRVRPGPDRLAARAHRQRDPPGPDARVAAPSLARAGRARDSSPSCTKTRISWSWPSRPACRRLPGRRLPECDASCTRSATRAPDAAPLHRLGRWTSGVVLFARTLQARRELSRQWAAREIGKRYRALALGKPARTEFSVSAPIGPVPHPLLGSVHGVSPEGKPSMTRVALLEQRGAAFLCDVSITTGRPHQIRIHLAAAGHPLEGDPLYTVGGLPAPDSTCPARRSRLPAPRRGVGLPSSSYG